MIDWNLNVEFTVFSWISGFWNVYVDDPFDFFFVFKGKKCMGQITRSGRLYSIVLLGMKIVSVLSR